MLRSLIVEQLFFLTFAFTRSARSSVRTLRPATPLFIVNIWTGFPKLTTPFPHFSFIHCSRSICFTQLSWISAVLCPLAFRSLITDRTSYLAGLFIFAFIITCCIQSQTTMDWCQYGNYMPNGLVKAIAHAWTNQCCQSLFITNLPLLLKYGSYFLLLTVPATLYCGEQIIHRSESGKYLLIDLFCFVRWFQHTF